MEAFVQQQSPSSTLERRFDYLALAPAAAAAAYPFLLKLFHAIVGMQASAPSSPAMVGATFILAVAFAVPFLGIALACRPTASPGSRRLVIIAAAIIAGMCGVGIGELAS